MITKDILQFVQQQYKNDLYSFIPLLENKCQSFDELMVILLKKRQTGYNLYQKMMYEKLIDDPSPFKDKSRLISKKWNSLSKNERNQWIEKATKLSEENAIVNDDNDEKEEENEICKGIIKNNHQPCTSKAKFNGYCGKHKKQINDNNFSAIEHGDGIREHDDRVMKVINDKKYYIDFYNKVYENDISQESIGYYNNELNTIEVLDEHIF